jgi:hypothetical protein
MLMTRYQKIELINKKLEHLDGEALEGLVKLLKYTKPTGEPEKLQDDIDEESRVWLEATLTPELPPYDWGDIDPLTLGEPLRFIKGKWVKAVYPYSPQLYLTK